MSKQFVFLFIQFLISTVVLTACKQARLKADADIAKEIVSEIEGADKVGFWNSNVGDFNFIQLEITGSPMIHKKNYSKAIVASYCATQLYKRLSDKTIEANSAIQVLFDGEDDGYITNQRSNLYEYKELKSAWLTFSHIENLVKASINLNYRMALEHLDESYSEDTAMELTQQISNAINAPITGFKHFYTNYYLYPDDISDSIECFSISTIIECSNDSLITMNFLIPKNEGGNRIMKVDI